MKWWCFFICLLIAMSGQGQKVQAVLPSRSLVEGTAFPVQFILTDPAGVQEVSTPVFEGFRIVSGPNRYRANALIEGRVQPIENITFTLLPLSRGKFRSDGLAVTYASGVARSGPLNFEVLPPEGDTAIQLPGSTLLHLARAGTEEELKKRLRDHVFIRATLNRKRCYIGEPLVLEFKLYSDLQTVTEMVKMPPLYGFSTIDMFDLSSASIVPERIGNRVFNTMVLRKVQLFPERAGLLTVEEMVLGNDISWQDAIAGASRTIYTEYKTDPLQVEVLPLPQPQPAGFSGAVGTFELKAELQPKTLTSRSGGALLITIGGVGNLMSIEAPRPSLPSAIELFDPRVEDSINIKIAPMQGWRRFHFPISSSKEGSYIIPPLKFSFFNPALQRYQTITSDSLKLEVMAARIEKTPAVEVENKKSSGTLVYVLIALLLLLPLLLLILRKRKRQQPTMPGEQEASDGQSSMDALNGAEWEALSIEEACVIVIRLLQTRDVEKESSEKQRTALLRECQYCAYSGIPFEGGKEALRERTMKLLKDNSPAH